MVLYINEGILNEAVNGDEVIKAIDNRVGVLITYKGEDNEHTGVRYIEPYVYGATTRNNPAIRAYQYYGDTKRGVPAWKLLRLDRIESWEPTDNKFDLEPQARGWAAQAFNGDDKLLPKIFKVVNLEETPTTDLEKLRARTRQIKQAKPININQINTSKKSPIQQAKKNSGPIDGTEPETGVENPQPTQTQVSQPVNNDGTPKNNGPSSPIKQEPKKTGPVIGNPTNPAENNPDELMSNDQFRDMLKRNLDLTDKEKQGRGFKLS